VKKLVTNTGMIKIDFNSLDFDFKPNKSTEAAKAKNDDKSPNQANAKLDNTDAINNMKKTLVLLDFGVL